MIAKFQYLNNTGKNRIKVGIIGIGKYDGAIIREILHLFFFPYAILAIIFFGISFLFPFFGHAADIYKIKGRTEQRLENSMSFGNNFRNKTEILKALCSYEVILGDAPNNHEILLKAAYLHYLLGWLYENKNEEIKRHYYTLLEYAKHASQIYPEDYYTLLLLTLAKAKTVGYLPLRNQVRIVRELVDDIQSLRNTKTDDPDAIYLLSWINFKVGRVSLPEKFLAAVLFGGLPEGLTVENSFTLMNMARELRPCSIVYEYDLGLFFLRTGNTAKALQQFRKARSIDSKSVQGAVYRRRAEKQIQQLCKTCKSKYVPDRIPSESKMSNVKQLNYILIFAQA